MNHSMYGELLKELDAGRKAAIVTVIENENDQKLLPKKRMFTEADLFDPTRTDIPDIPDSMDESLSRKVQYALESGNLQFVGVPDGGIHLIEPVFPEPRLIVLGGGHIARPLAEFGAKVGFAVTVVDDRPSFANKERFPDAENVICESFARCFSLLTLTSAAFVVIVTRGHRHDLDCLRQALEYDTAYLGMIGSRRRVQAVKAQLLSEGFSQERLDKVCAPIGLGIGAVTPEEIAIAIVAQVIGHRRAAGIRQGNMGAQKAKWPEFDRAVLAELSKESPEPKAIGTVVSTKGSVPREAGAKMLVWPHGKLLGSIGGGCSEGEVIRAAREVIRNRDSQILELDLTGSIAEEEGMACGGRMQVLIEYYDSKAGARG